MGRALPGRPGRNHPGQGPAAPQIADGRPDPRAAARPAGPGPLRRRAARRRAGHCCRRPRHQARRTPSPPAGQALIRSVTTHHRGQHLGRGPGTGKRRNLTGEEDHAFWAWATIEVLRATGIRVEELVELSHHSLVQYRLPATGELVPLLQIAPSKTDAERLLVVSPELADVLTAIISRIRGTGRAVPLIAAYDDHERLWLPPAPVLFQRRIGAENRAHPRRHRAQDPHRRAGPHRPDRPRRAARCTSPPTISGGCSSPTPS